MSDDPRTTEQLELLRAQRARLASVISTPWWYVSATALSWAIAAAMPFGSRYVVGGGAGCAVLAIAVLLLAQYALAQVNGVEVGVRTWRYPSGRVWTVAIVVIIVAACEGETLLLDRGLLTAAVLVGVLAAGAGTGCWLGRLRSIRRDLGAGRGAL